MPKQIGWSNESNLLYTISSQISRLAGIIATSGGGGGGTITGGGASGQVTFWDAATNITGSNNLFWDATNSRLGIGINAPSVILDILRSQNAETGVLITNSNNNASAYSALRLKSNGVGELQLLKFSQSTTAYKIAAAGDGVIFNNGAYGDLAILNDLNTGKIKFAAGGVSTAQMVLHQTGNLSLGSTTDDNTNRLQVSGSIKATQDSTINSISIGLGNNNIATNTRIGVSTLAAITSGSQNTVIGHNSGIALTTGSRNVVIGKDTLNLSTNANENVAIGANSMQASTSGSNCVSIGYYSLNQNSSGNNNVGIGTFAISDTRGGANNIGIGTDAGRYVNAGTSNQTYSNSIYIGSDTRSLLTGSTNEIVIGYQGRGRGTNTTTIGNSSTTSTWLGGNLLLGNTTDTTERLQVTGDVKITGKLALTVVTNRQTVNYSLVLADNGKLVETNVGAANTITVPPNSSITFPIGTKIDIAQYGAGQTTIVPGIGVTVRSAGGALKLSAQYSGATIVKIGTDEWYLFGDITV